MVVAMIVAMIWPLVSGRQMTSSDWSEHTTTVLLAAAFMAVFIEFVLKKK